MNIKKKIASVIETAINDIESGALGAEDIEKSIEIPKKKEMGDYAFPCFKLAKTFRKAPQMIAQDIAKNLKSDIFEKVDIQGGFLNFKLKPTIFGDLLFEELNAKGDEYGNSDIGAGKKIVVEFSSANIAKPFHIGHLRSTMIGNSLYRIYKTLGYDAVAVNHLGDYGTQFGKLISAYTRWGNKDEIEKDPIGEFLKLYVKFHDEAEKDQSLEDEARAIFTKLENGDEEVETLWKWIKDLSLKEFMKVYDMLGVSFDSYNGEAFYSDKMDEVLEILRDKNIVENDGGAEIVNLAEYNMPNALITKSDGSTLYVTRDLAAAIYRIREYAFSKNIYVVAYQQDLHFKQLFKILELMGFEDAKNCVHVNFGMVSLEDGTLSTRKGRVVRLEEVLLKAKQMSLDLIEEKSPNLENKEKVAEQIGFGAIIFQDLYNQRVKDYTFSWKNALSFEGESAPYVQYAHARANTLIEKSGISPTFKGIDTSLITDEASQDLIKTLIAFPEAIVSAMEQNEPSKISRYCVNLAGEFNKFYNKNQINVEDKEVKKARIALTAATKQVIKKALWLVGVESPNKM